MDARKYFCYLLVTVVWTCPIVRCFTYFAPVRIEVADSNSKETFSNEDEIRNFCDGNFSKPIVSKCCDLGFGYTSENQSCTKTVHEFLPDFEDCDNHSEKAKKIPLRKRYEYYIDPCKEDRYILEPENSPEDSYVIYSTGILIKQNYSYEVDSYCLETVDGVIRAFLCFESEEFPAKATFTIYATGLLISIPFLIITAMLYLCIDDLRDLKGKSLACHCFCLAFAYFFLAVIQLASEDFSEDVCEAFGFLIQYFFVAAFTWLNVLCFDMWNCIRNDVNCKPGQLDIKSQKLTFICYCLYGFFASAALSVVSLIMSYTKEIPEIYVKPKFGFRSCWFHSSVAALSYFYGPIGGILSVNLLFFIMSVCKIYAAQKKQVKMLSKKRCHNETRSKIQIFRICFNGLRECFYLFLLMGLNFIAEIFSWAYGTFDFFWLLIDFFNLVQGVTIFIIFILKPNTVRQIIKQKLHILYCKIIKCNWSYTEKRDRLVPPHWHADVGLNSAKNNAENEMFL